MDAVEEIKGRLSIEDVVGEYVQLKRAGKSFKGLSPWTNEKTPSFIVSPEKQIWHDFSSGRGGDMFSFIMEVEGLEFKEALELLARRAGLDLDQYKGKPSGSSGKLKQRLLEANEQAAKFYQAHFSKNHTALEYVFKKRRFQKQTVLDFRLGYSPASGHALLDYLTKKGFSTQELQSAGLVSRRSGKLGDMFRGRLMVPLMDAQGSVVGFTARLLEENDKAPKYINTPSTPVYDKSRHVFGLHLAKDALRKSDQAIVVEGNLDVIAAHQAGTRQVVATAGTAMTAYHLKAISRLTQNISMCFDQDSAGQSATERVIPLASKAGVSLKVISLPSGKDPDELIRQDEKKWQETINMGEYALDWLITRYEKQLDVQTAEGKRKFSDIMARVIKNIDDAIEQDHYITLISEKLGVQPESLRSKISGTNTSRAALKKPRPQSGGDSIHDHIDQEAKKNEDHFLSIVLYNSKLSKLTRDLEPGMFTQPEARVLVKAIQANTGQEKNLRRTKALHQIEDYVKILELQYETLYQPLDEVELSYEASRQRRRMIELYVKKQKMIISKKILNADEKTTAQLLTHARELDKLLGSLKEGK